MPQTTNIMTMLADELEAVLNFELIGEMPEPYKAGLVQAGKLLDDPTITSINVLVFSNDEDWRDELNENYEGPDLAGPTFETGGGFSVWKRRRFRIEYKIFFEGSPTYKTARDIAWIVYSAAEWAIWNLMKVTPIIGPDSYGEKAVAVQIKNGYIREGGGDGEYNWRGEHRIEFLTHQETEE